MTRSLLILSGSFFLSAFLAITSLAQSPSPGAVVEDFVKAWNSNDPKAFDPLAPFRRYYMEHFDSAEQRLRDKNPTRFYLT